MTPFDYSVLGSAELQNFILENENADEKKLVLQHRTICGAPSAWVANQIAGRRKAKSKIPTFYKTGNIVYPSSERLEQSSSEATAAFKAGLILQIIPSKKPTGLDLASGYGIDAYFISRICQKLDCVDPDGELIELARFNHNLLGVLNIQYHTSKGDIFIKSTTERFDFIFVDPSRRKGTQKVFRLKDCEPNLISLLPSLLATSDHILIKASPLLDLRQGCAELETVSRVVVLSLDNECKELLFWCTKNIAAEIDVTCVNLSSKGSESDSFAFTFSEEKAATSSYSDPQTYLYEPNASILKAGAFRTVGARYGLYKLQSSTHLYTSDRLKKDFPGRIFEIQDLHPNARTIGSRFPDGKVNVLTRNYPFSPAQLKKKMKLHDGGDKYLLGFAGLNKKFLVEARRVK